MHVAIKKQQGAVLVVSMILLIVLTLYGLSASKNSIMQVNMTTMNNDAQIALSAAEAAIYQGILDIENMVSAPDDALAFGDPGRGNVYLASDRAEDLSKDSTWDNSGTFQTQPLSSTALSFSNQSAHYFIVYHGIIEDGDNNSKAGQSSPQLKITPNDSVNGKSSSTHLFRVVGMGKGAAGSSKRIVEAFYRRGFADTEEGS